MRVYLDNIIFSLQRSGGISVVWYELLKRMIDNHELDIKMLEYAEGKKNICRSILPIDDFLINKKATFNINVERFLNPVIREKNPFIFHSSYYRTVSNPKAINVTTVHDFIYEKYMKGISKQINCGQKYSAIRKSDSIICISESTKQDLLAYMPDVCEDKISVIYNGVSDDYFVVEGHDGELPFPANSYVLFVGGRAAGYKNFRFSVQAVAKTGLNLLIVGQQLSKEERQFLDEHLRNRYKIVSDAPNVVLNQLYNFAYCLLYPSSYEGFGIPVLEAQKAGCPVIAFNSSSIPEVIGDQRLLFHELSLPSVLDCLERLNDESFRADIVEKGVKNAKRFNWDKTYQEVLAVYKRNFESRPVC